MKKLKINYLFIGILALLLAVALWPSIPWFGKADNRIAAIQARGELRVSTIHTPLTYNEINGKPFGLDYELAKQFADYLGVKLKVTVRQNISQLFDDLDNGNADLLAAGLVYNSERVKNYQPGPTYYSVSQDVYKRQVVHRIGVKIIQYAHQQHWLRQASCCFEINVGMHHFSPCGQAMSRNHCLHQRC